MADLFDVNESDSLRYQVAKWAALGIVAANIAVAGIALGLGEENAYAARNEASSGAENVPQKSSQVHSIPQSIHVAALREQLSEGVYVVPEERHIVADKLIAAGWVSDTTDGCECLYAPWYSRETPHGV